MEHFFPQIQMKTKKKKKKVFIKDGTLFSPNSGEDQKKKEKGLHQRWNAFFPRIQVKTKKKKKKKGLHQKWNTFFPRIQVKTCAQMHTRVKLLGGDTDEDHTQIIGGDTVKLLGGI